METEGEHFTPATSNYRYLKAGKINMTLQCSSGVMKWSDSLSICIIIS